MRLALVFVMAGLVLAGCDAVAAPTSMPTAAGPSATAAVPSSCHARGSGEMVLPDPACTPGATNSNVTQANIAETICRSGWTKTVRPPVSYTDELKRQQMAAYGDTGSMREYEEDHQIPLELGGAPSDPKNLWPEPGASPNPKDRVENALNEAVCDGRMSLTVAQREIATNWITAGQQLGVL